MSNTSQIKVTIPTRIKNLLKGQASAMDMTLSAYIKLIIESHLLPNISVADNSSEEATILKDKGHLAYEARNSGPFAKTKIEVEIPEDSKELLQKKAAIMGMDLQSFAQLVLLSEIKDDIFPEFELTPEEEAEIEEAIKLDEEGKLIGFSSIEELDEYIRNYSDGS